MDVSRIYVQGTYIRQTLAFALLPRTVPAEPELPDAEAADIDRIDNHRELPGRHQYMGDTRACTGQPNTAYKCRLFSM